MEDDYIPDNKIHSKEEYMRIKRAKSAQQRQKSLINL